MHKNKLPFEILTDASLVSILKITHTETKHLIVIQLVDGRKNEPDSKS